MKIMSSGILNTAMMYCAFLPENVWIWNIQAGVSKNWGFKIPLSLIHTFLTISSLADNCPDDGLSVCHSNKHIVIRRKPELHVVDHVVQGVREVDIS